MRPRKGNGTRADDKGDEVHDSSQSLYIGRIRKKRRSREQAADEKILRKDDGGIEGEQGGSSRVGRVLIRCFLADRCRQMSNRDVSPDQKRQK